MGFLDKFFSSFEDDVTKALEEIRGMGLGVTNLGASVEDKVVTLTGNVPDMETKIKVVQAFNSLVETDNTINQLQLPAAVIEEKKRIVEAEPEPVVEEKVEQVYEVVSGDTLGAIAKRFYGNAGQYMKIFEANRDILDDPNLIKVGQKLRIPE